jgi:hypothetical protein
MLLLVCSCRSKPGDVLPDPQPTDGKSIFLLDSIVFTSPGATSVFAYNADSSIKMVTTGNGSQAYNILYTYDKGRLALHQMSNSNYSTTYKYANGKMTTALTLDNAQQLHGNKLAYTYRADGRVATLVYSIVNEAGEKPVYSSTYVYDAGGLLSKIETTGSTNRIIITINSYSEVCNFHPLVFMSHTVDEFYRLYNYPVMSQLERLPAKITYELAQGQEAPKVEKIYDNTYTIVNKRLEKMLSAVSYPDNPAGNQTRECSFYYK